MNLGIIYDEFTNFTPEQWATMAKQAAESEKSSDPNLAGADQTRAVKREAPALMTPSDEYDQNEPYHKPQGTA